MTPTGRRAELIAHRGASSERPENTVPAFLRALECDADGIELDVHATRDGVVVVHHDAIPHVEAPGPGLARRPIAELTLAELQGFRVALDVGVPTLGEALEAIGDRAVVYVELKGRDIERRVIDVIRRSGARCAIHSFDHAAVRRAHELAPDLRTGLLYDRYPEDPAAALRAAGALDVWPQWDLIDARLVERVHDAGGRMIAWTVDSPEVAARLVDIGVDGVCTNDLALVGPAVHDAGGAARPGERA